MTSLRKHLKTPGKLSLERAFPTVTCPILEKLIQQEAITAIECAFATYLGGTVFSNGLYALLCFLLRSALEGHLCIEKQEVFYPNPRIYWEDPQEPILTREEWEELLMQMGEAMDGLKEPLCHKEPTLSHLFAPLCLSNNKLYLQRNWFYEAVCLQSIVKRLQSPQSETSHIKIPTSIQQSLLPNQIRAIIIALQHDISIITGGPGTGKTYTAAQLVKVLFEGLNLTQRQDFKVAVTAPTGKAASHLHRQLCRHLPIDAISMIEMGTLAALLKLRRDGQDELFSEDILDFDLIIVDESSMIDIKTMALLLFRVKDSSKLVFLGDPHQLPPIECGHFFADLCAEAESDASWPLVKLDLSVRSQYAPLLNLASSVRLGDCQAVLHQLKKKEDGLNYIECNTEWELQRTLFPYLKSYPVLSGKDDAAEVWLNEYNKSRLLTPLRKGPLGVVTINQNLTARYQKQAFQAGCSLWVPIMINVNDGIQELYNGEMGVLYFPKGKLEPTVAYFFDEKEKLRAFHPAALPNFEHAWAISVHKSQGSEFEEVVLVMPRGAEKFGRQVVYTAVTRAKKKISILAMPGVLEQSILKKEERLSHFYSRQKNCVSLSDSFS